MDLSPPPQVAPATLDRMKSAVIPAALLAALLSFRAADHELSSTDECRSGTLVQDMLRGGHWLLPRTPDGYLVEKPPAYYAAAAGSCSLLGVGEWGLRLPSLLAAFGTLVAVYFIAAWAGSPRAGWMAQVFLAGNVLFVSWSRMAMVDMTFTCFLTIGLALLVGARAGRIRWTPALAGAGACAGLAVLTKGPLGLALPAAGLAGWHLVETRGRIWRASTLPGRPLLLAGTLALGIPLAWYVPALVAGRGEFLETAVLGENVYMALGAPRGIAGSHVKSFGFYWIRQAALLALVLPALLPALRHGWRKGTSDPLLPAWTFCALGFAIFLAASNKRFYYLLPLQPALLAGLAVAADRALAIPGERWAGIGLRISGAMALLAGAVLASGAVPLLEAHAGPARVAGVLLLLAGLVQWTVRPSAPAFALVPLLVAVLQVSLVSGERTAYDRVRPFVARAAALVPGSQPVAAVQPLEGYGVDFYWPRALGRADPAGALPDWILVRRHRLPGLRGRWRIEAELPSPAMDRTVVLAHRETGVTVRR